MKKLLFGCCLFCSFLAFFAACQKEFSIDDGLGQQAAGSLKDTSGNCLPDSVYGTWYTGVTPGDTNYVNVQVRVDSAGTYLVSTNTVNGLSFRDSGSFTSTGIQTVKLKPTGIPVAAQTSTFTVSFDSTSCSFSINVKDSTGTGLK